MDKVAVFLLLCLAACISGQDDPMKVEIKGDQELHVKEGTSLTLHCTINRGLALTLEYNVDWVHHSLVDPDNPVETRLTSMQALQDGASPDQYGIEVKYEANTLDAILTIKNVEAPMDGKFICRLDPKGNQEKLESAVDVVVVSDVDVVQLTFEDESPVTGEDEVPIEREEGDFEVSCSAAGFSPSATLSIFVGDEKQKTAPASVTYDPEASQAAGARRYKVMVPAITVKLTASHSDKKLRCEATADYQSDPAPLTKIASVPLSIIALEPVIECDKNATAAIGELYVKITCNVDHSNVDIDRYSFEIGDTGEIIGQGNVSASYDEVTVEKGDTMDKVTLDLYQAKDFHFDTVFYIDVFLKNGQRFRQKATLIKMDTAGAAGLMTVCTSVLLTLLTTVTILLRL